MAEPNTHSPPKRGLKRMVVSRLQHGWLKTMGVDVPWITATEPKPMESTKPIGKAELVSHAVSPVAPSPGAATPEAVPIKQSVASSGSNSSQNMQPAKSQEALPELDVSTLDLVQVSEAIDACRRCGLCETRQQAVAGDGVQTPTILVVGEAPGEQEDQQGKPFVGRSGQLLDNMLKAIGHGRDTSVYITNVVKCRPPGNRNPRDEEILACAPYLARQIALLAPAVILAMGRFAAHALLKTEAPLQKLRESSHTLEVGGRSLPVVVTYHPAYLLRRPVDKRLAWEDLKRLRDLLG